MLGLCQELVPGGGREEGRVQETEGERRPGGAGRGALRLEERGAVPSSEKECISTLRYTESLCGIILNRPKTSSASQPLEYKQDRLMEGSRVHLDRWTGWMEDGDSVDSYIVLSRPAPACKEQAGIPY